LVFELNTCVGKRKDLFEGAGLRFDLRTGSTKDPRKAGFAIEFDGRVFAYENRCPHLGVELDWAPGVFFDATQEYLLCSTHGARFKPDTGKCVSGPCAGQSLMEIAIFEEKGELFTLEAGN
jgi:nitrite reductase/ring-hydroxylating ferredoxin subunit